MIALDGILVTDPHRVNRVYPSNRQARRLCVNYLIDYFMDTWAVRTARVCIDFMGLMDAWLGGVKAGRIAGREGVKLGRVAGLLMAVRIEKDAGRQETNQTTRPLA